MRLELLERALEQEGVRAQVNVAPLLDQALDDLVHLGVDERLTPGDGYDRRAALFGGGQRLLGRDALFEEDVVGELDFAAALAGEVAAEKRFEHEDQRVTLVTTQFLAEHIRGHGPGLGKSELP